MAAVIRTILGRKGKLSSSLGGSRGHHNAFPTTASDVTDKPNKNDSFVADQNRSVSFIMEGLTEKQQKLLDKSVRRIQSWYRGAKTRTLLRTVWGVSSDFTSASIRTVLNRVIKIHRGWEKFILHMILLIMFIVMVIFQAKYPSPDGSEVNQSIIRVVDSANFVPFEQVTRSQQVFDYVEALVTVFGEAMNPGTFTRNLTEQETEMFAHCREIYDIQCKQTWPANMTQTEILTELTNCLDAQAQLNDAYVDNQNRMQFGMFITQQRYKTKPCSHHIEEKNPLTFLPKHACLDPGTQANQYESEVCGNITNPTPARCFDYSEFYANSIIGAYVSILAPGNLGSEIGQGYTRCRINALRERGWLDYRTKAACLHMFFFNENQQGRLTAFRDCFDFSIGGLVVYSRDVASSSFPPDGGTVVGVTVGFIIAFVMWTLWELREGYRRGRRNFRFCNDGLGLVLFALFVTDLAIFFDLNISTEHYQQIGPQDLSQFVNTEQFWMSMTNFVSVLNRWQSYFSLLAVTLFLLMIRILTVLDFHPTLGIVSGTLKIALNELGSFFFVYAIVVISYACLGILFFGQNSPRFANFGSAIVNLIFTSLMEVEEVGLMVLDPAVNIGSFENANWIGVIWYYSFLILVSILLFNVLLSIVVGAFVDFQENRKDRNQYFSLFHTFWMSLQIWGRRIQGIFAWCCGKRSHQPTTNGRRIPPTGTSKLDFKSSPFFMDNSVVLNRFQVIDGLNVLRMTYSKVNGNATNLRNELKVLFADEFVYEKIIANIRQLSIREKHTPDLLTMRAMHFKEDQYKAHMFVLGHKLLSKPTSDRAVGSRQSSFVKRPIFVRNPSGEGGGGSVSDQEGEDEYFGDAMLMHN